MGRDGPRFLAVGHIVKPHGIKGEFLVLPLTDHPQSTYRPGVVLHLGSVDSANPDPGLPDLKLEQVRPYRNGYIASAGGITDRNDAERLRGHYLFREVSALEPLGDGEFFYHQLLGMKVQTNIGTVVGEVTEVYELDPNDILCVQGHEGEIMIPFSKEIVLQVNADEKCIVIDPPDGLLDL
jgi:16S rRNA processing protein RimM|tara:strand:- start:1110 stop:1652 length:543 start_codon:yes stop_codon:yes gene_type:complete